MSVHSYTIKPGLVDDKAPKSDNVAFGPAGVSGQTGATIAEARGRKINNRTKAFIGSEMSSANSTANRTRAANKDNPGHASVHKRRK